MPKGVARLKKRAEFLRVAGMRRKWATPGIVLQAAPDPDGADAGFLRVGYTATKKMGNAVKRNRIKRRLRALADELLPQHAKHWDYVLIGRQATINRDFQSLRNDLLFALEKVGALKESPLDA